MITVRPILKSFMVGGKSGCFFKIGLKIETAGIFHQILKTFVYVIS